MSGAVRRPNRDLLDLHASLPGRYPFLLQSAVQGTSDSRYDILFCASGGSLALPADAPGPAARQFLALLDRWTRGVAASAADESRQSLTSGAEATDLPFTGGWFVLLGYELARGIEPVLAALPDPAAGCPQGLAVRCPAAIVYDHQRGQTFGVAEAGHRRLLPIMQQDYQQCPRLPDAPVPASAVLREADPNQFVDAVGRVREYIFAGDVFQANISRPWDGTLVGDAVTLYRQLRETNPAPFAGIARWGEHAVVSSSPERLVKVAGLHVQTRPIAGTFPRKADPAADEAQRQAMLSHPKERAEHVMLIDLERNDLGRICQPGSIAVDEFMTTESYPNVHHIVSSVSGQRRPDAGPVDVIRAVFPGGTITGCPKVRCMQIIGELEGRGRGPYTGAMGYVNSNGDLDLNILIRSFHLSGDRLCAQAGAGIVADSEPQRELEETRHKARGLLNSVTAVDNLASHGCG